MKYLILILYLSLCLPSLSHTLKGGLSYTVEQARYEAFYNVPTQIDIKTYKKFFIDKNVQRNLKGIANNKFEYNDRIIVKFIDEFNNLTYSVNYKNNRNVVFFYSSLGHLQYIDFIYSEKHPRKTASYNIFGQLDSISLSITSDNQYVFDTNKKLIGHWIGNNGYNEKGELIMTRE